MICLTREIERLEEDERREEEEEDDDFYDSAFDKSRLLRFGYLSVEERRRLRRKYPDLEARFEPDSIFNSVDGYEYAILVFFIFMFGFFLGAGDPGRVSIMHWVVAVVAGVGYWVLALNWLGGIEKKERERHLLYQEWRQ